MLTESKLKKKSKARKASPTGTGLGRDKKSRSNMGCTEYGTRSWSDCFV